MAETPPSPFDELIGTEWIEIGPEPPAPGSRSTDHHKQPFGLVHGGVFAALAESLCSARDHRAVGDEAWSRWRSPTAPPSCGRSPRGHVNAVARRRHRGRTTWVWDVEISDDEGRLCALVPDDDRRAARRARLARQGGASSRSGW